MPSDIQTYLISNLALIEGETLNKVYLQNCSNSFINGLVSILNKEMSENNCLLKYSAINKSKIGFVGSIAHRYKDVLKEVAGEYNLTINNVLRRPIEKLSSKEMLEMDFVNEEN